MSPIPIWDLVMDHHLVARSIMKEMDDIASIKMLTFKAVSGTFFALAIISVIARAIIRYNSRPKPTLDDYLMFFGTACLIAGTGLLYRNLDNMYATQAIWEDPMFLFKGGDNSKLQTALMEFQLFNKIALSLIWTTTFAVKLSFLAFFSQLIQSVDGNIRKYYWFVVTVTILSWMFVTGEQHILCPHVGMASLQCAASFSGKMYFSLTGLVTALDVGTDILLVSIPIRVLRKANMRTSQKLAVGVFLCLSLVMAIIAIVRVSKMHGHVAIDIPYEMFWQYIEAAVAILMASLTAYRTFFVRYRERQRYEERMKKGRTYTFRSWRRKVFRQDTQDVNEALPQVPRATMTGLFTFIRHNNKTAISDTDATEIGSTISKERLTDKSYSSERDTDYMSESVALSPITNVTTISRSDRSDGGRTDPERTAVGSTRNDPHSVITTFGSERTW